VRDAGWAIKVSLFLIKAYGIRYDIQLLYCSTVCHTFSLLYQAQGQGSHGSHGSDSEGTGGTGGTEVALLGSFLRSALESVISAGPAVNDLQLQYLRSTLQHFKNYKNQVQLQISQTSHVSHTQVSGTSGTAGTEGTEGTSTSGRDHMHMHREDGMYGMCVGYEGMEALTASAEQVLLTASHNTHPIFSENPYL
jgi:hypothetical protein